MRESQDDPPETVGNAAQPNAGSVLAAIHGDDHDDGDDQSGAPGGQILPADDVDGRGYRAGEAGRGGVGWWL